MGKQGYKISLWVFNLISHEWKQQMIDITFKKDLENAMPFIHDAK